MTNILIRLFIKSPEDVTNSGVREQYGKLAGAVGIVSNLLLVIIKLVAGFVTGSISVMADAVNNLSDCASSVITLVSFKLAGMPADEKHPYGHARYEYISGFVVSFFILAIGFQFFTSSLKKALNPETVAFSGLVVALLVISMAVKLWQGLFNKSIGRRIDSLALEATAADSINDVVATLVVLAGLLIAHFTGWSLDGWLGMLVSGFILYSGGRLVIDTINPLLGVAPDPEFVRDVEERILGYESVIGVHDMIIHNYGPGRCFISAHVEVPANQDILISHDIIDNIEREISQQLGVEIVIHLDPLVTDDERLDSFRVQMAAIVRQIDPVLTIHDFRMVEGKTHTNFIFDVVIPPRFQLEDDALRRDIDSRAKAIMENCYCVITVDRSYTSTRPEA